MTPHSDTGRPLPIRLLIVFGIALAAAVTSGGLVGSGVYALVMDSSSASDPWAELGAVIFGLAAGVLVGGAAYLTGIVVGVRRTCARGERLWPAVALLAAPCGLWFFSGLVSLAAGG